MQLGKSVSVLGGTAFRILWLVVLALSTVVRRRCRHWLVDRCPWDGWHNSPPC